MFFVKNLQIISSRCLQSRHVLPKVVGKTLKMKAKNSENEDSHQLPKVKEKFDSGVRMDEEGEITLEELHHKKNLDGWTDTFGTLADQHARSVVEEKVYEDDKNEIDEFEKPYQRLDTKFRKHEPDWYGRKIEKLGKKRLVYEALEVLEKEMLVEDRVKPNAYVFNTLIGIFGRVGYTKKAFQLFNKMKKFGLRPDSPTYTALFNSCSNSPWIEDGKKRADHLRALMLEQGVEVNVITYNAMIKAYALLKDLTTAFSLADEAMEKGLKLSEETFSSLLMACISDKEAGFGLSIKLWRLMRKRKMAFNTFSYNLLLRAARDCSLGNEHILGDLFGDDKQNNFLLSNGSSSALGVRMKESFDKIGKNEDSNVFSLSKKSENLMSSPKSVLIQPADEVQDHQVSVTSSHNDKNVGNIEQNVIKTTQVDNIHLPLQQSSIPSTTTSSNVQTLPNILNPNFIKNKNFTNPGLISVNNPVTATERLVLLGGVDGVLRHFKKDGCTPNIKTFSLFLDMIPSLKDHEDQLISCMGEYKIKPDLPFCNALIRKRNLRDDFKSAKEVIDMLTTLDLQPDLKTFGCLAMGCSSETRGLKLLQDMKALKLLPNAEICDILIYQSQMNFKYKLKILHFMKENQIRPNLKILEKLEKHVDRAKKIILNHEREKMGKDQRNKNDDEDDVEKFEIFQENFEKFLMNYKPWLKSMPLEPQLHPWSPYEQPTPKLTND